MTTLSANCPRCGDTATGREDIQAVFGFRYAGTKPQSQCRRCRKTGRTGPSLPSVMATLRFGVEVEFSGYCNLASLAQTLAVACGGSWAGTNQSDRYRNHSENKFLDSEGRKWKVVPDGSVSGGELVSPILTMSDMGLVQTLVRAIKVAGHTSTADGCCGVHVHLDKPEDPAHLRNFIRLVNHYEDTLWEALNVGSRRSTYCRKLHPGFVSAVEKLTNKAEDNELREAWSTHVGTYERYRAVNLHPMYGAAGSHSHGTVELRWFNGSLHAGEVKSYVMLALGLMAKARTAKQVSGTRAAVAVGTTAKLEALRKMLANVGCGNKTAEFHFANGLLAKNFEAKLAWSRFESLRATVKVRTEREEADRARGYDLHGRAV